MSQKVIVPHISDLDGRVSRELYVYLTNIHVDTPTVWVEYGELIEKAHNTVADWATGRDVTILDFSVSQKFLDDVAEVAESVLLFDHHTKTKELVAPANTTIICDTNESTVSLLWKFHKGASSKLPKIIEVCREIDLNLIENIDVLSYKLYLEQDFMKSLNEYCFWNIQYHFKALLELDLVPSMKYEAYKQLKEAEKLAKKAVINRADRTATIHRDERHKGIDTDILAHFMLQNRKVDFAIVSFDLNSEKRIFSVRKFKSTKRSLEEYVEGYGGGGRETAGSYSITLGAKMT